MDLIKTFIYKFSLSYLVLVDFKSTGYPKMAENKEKTKEKAKETAHEELKEALEEKAVSLEKEENSSKNEANDLIEQLQRIQAEFENYKKRSEKEKQEILILGKATVIVKILNILDDFERAFELIKETKEKELQKGVEMIIKQLHKFLQEEGIRAIQTEGKTFDPFMHEAMKVESSDKDNVVLKELQKGYLFNNKVIRTSKVIIGKNTEAK